MSIYKNILLEKMLRMKQNTLKKFLKKNLKRSGYEVINKDGYLYAKGTYPVLLVAHMDTVHKEPVQTINRINPVSVIFSPQGIGGDDRCGCYLILKMIEYFNCSVLFVEDEEIGCIGATKFIKDFDCSTIDVNYIVEFDRRGSNDCVFYDCDNKDFEDFVTSTGYFKTQYGSFSDICVLAPEIGVAAVNLSCGYYNEHTKEETINLLELETILEESKKLLSKESNKFEYIENRFSWRKQFNDYYGWYDEDDYYESIYDVREKETSDSDKIYHIYLSSGYSEPFCVEVSASNKYEAIGKVLSEYTMFCYEDITCIYSEDEYESLIDY